MVSLRSLVRSLLLLCLVLALTGCGSGDGPVSSDAGEAPASGKPSAAGAAAQATVAASGPTTLTVEEGLSVVVPEGAAPAGAALVVQPVEAAEPHAFSGLTALGSFDVTLGDLSAFEQPLELRFGYDPAALRETRSRRAAYGTWMSLRAAGWRPMPRWIPRQPRWWSVPTT